MALAKTIEKTVFGQSITFSNAYHKIFRVEGDKNLISLNVSVSDANQENFIETRQYNFTPSVADGSENFIKQGYEYMKTLSEYADAADV